MTYNANIQRILILGDDTTAARAGVVTSAQVLVEIVESLEEVADKRSRENYDRIIVDPDFLAKSGVELLSPTTLSSQCASTPSPVAYIDLQFNFIWANRPYERLFGQVIHSLVGRNYFDVHPHPEHRRIFERVLDSGIPDSVSMTPDLSVSESANGLSATVSPLRNSSQGLCGLVLSFAENPGGDRPHDTHLEQIVRQRTEELQAAIHELRAEVEERRQVEDTLTQAHRDAQRRAAEIESFVSGMTDGIALFDAEGNAHLINETAQRMLEVGPRVSHADWSAVVMRHSTQGDPLPTEQIPSFRALRGETVIDARHKLITQSGREFMANISAAPVRDSHEQVIGATLVFRDISDLVAFEDKRREVYEREHRIAEILQQALIPPQVNYSIERCRIAVKYQPALDEAAVGGDFYDIFEMDDGKVGILIGDIAGKGLPAAMRVAAVRYAVRSYAFLDPSPSVVMTLANQALCREEADDIGLLTAFFAVLDVHTGVVTYSNGGHEPPVVRSADGNVEELELQGGGLGFFDGFVYAEASLHLLPGDVMVMVTDGITEARSPSRDFFNKKGLKRYLSGGHHSDLDSLAQGLVDAARAHADGNLQDDAAVVVLQMESAKEP
ncbi:MAG: PP2C family protein-serine/threonine phosphatase [Armatimonadota bacterium]